MSASRTSYTGGLIPIVSTLCVGYSWINLPVVIMFLIIQDIHHDIIFELMQYVQLNHDQYSTIVMAMTQLHFFKSCLRTIVPSLMSRIFARFKTLIFSRIRNNKCRFPGTIPSLEDVRHLVSKIVAARTDSSQISTPQIGELFSSLKWKHCRHIFLLKTALEMQSMIKHLRVRYPEIISSVANNEVFLKKIIWVWRRQVDLKHSGVSAQHWTMREPPRINDMFVVCIIMAIEPRFFDNLLDQIIKNGGDCSNLMPYSGKYLNFLCCECRTIEHTTLQQGDIGEIIKIFSSMSTYSIERGIGPYVTYVLTRGRIGFGEIVCFDQPEFEELSIEIKRDELVINIFPELLTTFFKNLSKFMPHCFLGYPPHALAAP